jgi:hypothetical protein
MAGGVLNADALTVVDGTFAANSATQVAVNL